MAHKHSSSAGVLLNSWSAHGPGKPLGEFLGQTLSAAVGHLLLAVPHDPEAMNSNSPQLPASGLDEVDHVRGGYGTIADHQGTNR